MLEFLADADKCTDGSALGSVVALLKTAINILQILIPIALILWGTLDMGKAVIAGDEKKIKEAQKPFVKRLISAVIVFLIPYLLNLVIGIVAKGDSASAWVDCWQNDDLKWNQVDSKDLKSNE